MKELREAAYLNATLYNTETPEKKKKNEDKSRERYRDREDKDFHLDPVKNEYEYYCMDQRRQPSLMLLIVSDLSSDKNLTVKEMKKKWSCSCGGFMETSF